MTKLIEKMKVSPQDIADWMFRELIRRRKEGDNVFWNNKLVKYIDFKGQTLELAGRNEPSISIKRMGEKAATVGEVIKTFETYIAFEIGGYSDFLKAREAKRINKKEDGDNAE